MIIIIIIIILIEYSLLFNCCLIQLFSSEADTIDIESETFSALPPEMQHDLLLEKKEMQKYSYSNPSILPKVSSI